jgi:hypothetical protein
VEVTGNTRLFHEAVAPQVKRVVAVDPNQFKVISHSVKKTDPNDARNLALYLAKDLQPEVRMKEKTQARRSRTRSTTSFPRTASTWRRKRYPGAAQQVWSRQTIIGASMKWLRPIFRRSLVEREMDAEFRFHLDQLAAALQREGLTAEEARGRARLEFGGIGQVKDDAREARLAGRLDRAWRELRYAARSLARKPRFYGRRFGDARPGHWSEYHLVLAGRSDDPARASG